MYQYFVRTDDRDVIAYLKYFTFMSLEDIAHYAHLVETEPHRREAQKRLAAEFTGLIHGDDAVRSAVAATELLYGGSTDDITVKNDADTTVLNVATGATDVEVSAGNLLFGTGSKGVYLGVTSATAANLLDDYEEGTWTPTLVGATTAGTSLTYGTQRGDYTKIGNTVSLHYQVYVTGKDDIAGGISIGGIPFTSTSVSSYRSGGAIGNMNKVNWASGDKQANTYVSASYTSLSVLFHQDDSGAVNVDAGDLTNQVWFMGSHVYQV